MEGRSELLYKKKASAFISSEMETEISALTHALRASLEHYSSKMYVLLFGILTSCRKHFSNTLGEKMRRSNMNWVEEEGIRPGLRQAVDEFKRKYEGETISGKQGRGAGAAVSLLWNRDDGKGDLCVACTEKSAPLWTEGNWKKRAGGKSGVSVWASVLDVLFMSM